MYEIREAEAYTQWFDAQDKAIRNRIDARLNRAAEGNFGQHEYERDNISAIIFKTLGIRIYYCKIGERIYLLLTGGNKNTKKEQTRDIDRAIEIMRKELEK